MANFLNEKYIIDFSVPRILQESINYAEEADKNNDLATYLTYMENIDVLAKNCYASGEITKKMWDTLSRRYI